MRELSKPTLEFIEELYKWSKESADRIRFGAGAENGSFTYHCMINTKTVSIFSVYTNGNLILNFEWLSRKLENEILLKFHKRLIEIEPFGSIPTEFDRWPSVKIESAFVGHPEYLKRVHGNSKRIHGEH